MRVTAIVFALALSITGTAAAQEWDQFVSLQDGFKINFPGKPTITETTWKSQLEYTLPARVYTAVKGLERYIVTVVDYSGLEQQGVERSKTCEPGTANCRPNAGIWLGPGYWRHDERGAIMYATFRMLERDAKMTALGWEWQDMVEGNLVHLTNADRSRTKAFISMHQHKLLIIEGTVPDGYPEPGIFQESLGWVDKDGNGIRYQIIYSNSYHGMGVYPVPGYNGSADGAAGRGAGAGGAGGRGAGPGGAAGAGGVAGPGRGGN